MTNDFDDLEQQEAGHEFEAIAKPGMRANLANAWRSQPLIKLLVLMVVVVAVVGVSFSLFSGGNERKNTTSLGTPPDLHEPPGGAASPYVREQTVKANEQREEDAINKGSSSMPTPLGSDTSPKDDPLKELKAQIETLTREVNQPKPAAPAPQQPVQQVQQPEQFDDSLAKAMQKQMGDLAGGWNARGIKLVNVTKTEDVLSEKAAAAAAAASAAASNSAPPPNNAVPAPKVIVAAGTVSYAKLLTQANSDVPGPIIAEIVSGPLTGARAVGSFEVTNGYSEYLVLKFSLAELKGKEYQINTVAIDPNNTLPGLATDVDERYFERVVLPAAASFISGFGSALSNNNSTTSTNGTTTITTQAKNGFREGYFNGLGKGADTVSQFFQNQANNTKPLVIVAQGTPLGILFVTSVKDAPDTQPVYGQPQQPTGLAGYSSTGQPTGIASYLPNTSGFTGGNYPGATIPGYGQSTGNSNVPYPNYATQQNNTYGYNGYGNGTQGYGSYGNYGNNGYR